MPYLFDKYSYFKSNKPLKETCIYWVAGAICWEVTEIISFILILLHGEINFVCIGISVFLIGIFMTICNVTKQLAESQRYSDKIIECLKNKKVKIFYHKDEYKVLWARINLEKWNLNSKFYNIKDINEELDTIIDRLKEKEIKILKIRYRIGYKIKKSKSMKEYIKKHPQSANIILEYEGKYAVGCSKKKIDKLIIR